MTSLTYPTGTAYGYQYNSMGQVGTMTEGGSPIASATYLLSGALSTLTYDGWAESRTYNNLLQLTRMTTTNGGTTLMDMQYIFPAGSNNGQISQSIDGVTGEQVTYTYDSLNRLIAAQTSDSLWGNAYAYDGFGNLLSKTVTKGTSPSLSVNVDALTNRIAGQTYDANGNPAAGAGYDLENRYLGTAPWHYGYDPAGKRIWEYSSKLHFYGITGQKLVTYQLTVPSWSGPTGYISAMTPKTNVYFGGKLIRAGGVTIATDRLGSVRRNSAGENFAYYPYGEERTSTADGREKFGTYTRDGLGQDYADQRYYAATTGRFWTPDPYLASGGPPDPASWNRYAYVSGDPVNFYDPSGLFMAKPGRDSWGWFGPSPGFDFTPGPPDLDYSPDADPGGGGGGGAGSGEQPIRIENGRAVFSVKSRPAGTEIPKAEFSWRTGPPNSFFIEPAQRGSRIRTFGPSGNADIDIDFQGDPHIHRWRDGVRGKIHEPLPPEINIPKPVHPPDTGGRYSPYPRQPVPSVPPATGRGVVPPGTSLLITIDPCRFPIVRNMVPSCTSGPLM